MPKVKAVPQITYNTIAKFQYINRFYSTLITIFTLFTQCICLFVSETKKNRKKAAFQLGFLSHKLRNKTATRFSTLILHFSFCILHFCIPPPSKAWSPTLLHSSNVPLQARVCIPPPASAGPQRYCVAVMCPYRQGFVSLHRRPPVPLPLGKGG